jgi:hypothetical protein
MNYSDPILNFGGLWIMYVMLRNLRNSVLRFQVRFQGHSLPEPFSTNLALEGLFIGVLPHMSSPGVRAAEPFIAILTNVRPQFHVSHLNVPIYVSRGVKSFAANLANVRLVAPVRLTHVQLIFILVPVKLAALFTFVLFCGTFVHVEHVAPQTLGVFCNGPA